MANIFDEAKSGDMPPLEYRLLHWDARLSKANMQALSMLGWERAGVYILNAFENSSVIWNDATLEKWLSDSDLMRRTTT